LLTNSELKPDPLVLLGQHLVQLRKARGWSQEQLALECGMARSYLGGVERWKRNIALLNICKLADALSVYPLQKCCNFKKIN